MSSLRRPHVEIKCDRIDDIIKVHEKVWAILGHYYPDEDNDVKTFKFRHRMYDLFDHLVLLAELCSTMCSAGPVVSTNWA